MIDLEGVTIAAMRSRRSVRSYDPAGLDGEETREVRDVLRGVPAGPFGGRARFELLDLDAMDPRDRARLGTYGTIRGARYFAAGAIDKGPRAREDFGWCMEAVVLRLTSLGMGTCWLGGIFRRKWFARAMGLQRTEELPAVTPVGRPAGRDGLVQAAMAGAVGARARLPWIELFHLGEAGVPLRAESAGSYSTVLECLRIGPSASNRQPWRVIRDARAPVYHLYLRRTLGYAVLTSTDLQRLDMGIAMLHFQAAAEELGFEGRWRRQTPDPPGPARWEYIATWEGDDEEPGGGGDRRR